VPDRKRRWTGEDLPDIDAPMARHSSGCKFAARCPAVMDDCWQNSPPLYRPDRQQVAACFLHRDSPLLESSDVGQVFPKD
jgi:ABC-type dipeptide/oligopeptide/nickel transport system ATPase component